MTIFSLSPKDVHRDSVRRKFHLMRSVKIVQGLDQTDTADLKQVVHILASVLEFLYDAEHQPQIARDKLLSQAGISGPDLFNHLVHLYVFHYGKA